MVVGVGAHMGAGGERACGWGFSYWLEIVKGRTMTPRDGFIKTLAAACQAYGLTLEFIQAVDEGDGRVRAFEWYALRHDAPDAEVWAMNEVLRQVNDRMRKEGA